MAGISTTAAIQAGRKAATSWVAPSLTLAMIKPHAVSRGDTGKILDAVLGAGFEIASMKTVRLSAEHASQFYATHRHRAFFPCLVTAMSSGPVVVAMLRKAHAVAEFRALLGSTDPGRAAEGSLRRRFGLDILQNAVHGSDSDEQAAIECDFYFSKIER